MATNERLAHGFHLVVEHVERAKGALVSAMPSARRAGTPLAEALHVFETEIAAARERMPGWHGERWAECDHALALAAGGAERLRLEAPALDFEGLVMVLGDLIAPLDVFAEAERGFRTGRMGIRRGKEPVVDACSLLTKDEVEASVGETVHDGTSAPANVPTVCNFTMTADAEKNVSMVLYSPGGATMLPMMMPAGSVDISGLGDQAKWYGMGRIIGVLKGDVLVTIQFTKFIEDESATMERAKQLATAAAGRF